MMRVCTLIVFMSLALAAPAFAADDPACDVDGNGVCDVADGDIIVGAMNTQEGDPGFVPAADLDGDGIITPVDLSRFAQLKNQ